MNKDRQRIDSTTAEKLIRGERRGLDEPGGLPVGSDDPADLLAGLLAAATDPPDRLELAGEQAAVMAYRAARLASITESRRLSMQKTTLAKVATMKAAILVAALGGSGIALAAGSGNLPGVGTPDHASGRPADSAPGTAHEATGHVPGGQGSPSVAANAAAPGSSAAAAHGSAAPGASPSPNLRGLCTAFNAGAGDNPGKALDNPAFTVLITAAGGKDNVAAYCGALLATSAAAAPDHPTGTAHGRPAARSSHVPSSHPSGPEHAPSGHAPAGPPTHGD